MPMTARDRKVLKYGGIAVGAMLVLFFVSKLLSGGSGAFPPLPPTVPRQSTGTPSPTSGVLPPPAATERDPFAVPAGLGTSTESPTPSGTGSPTQTSSPTPSPTLPGNGASTQIGGHTVVLLDVYSVDGVEHAQV